MHEFDHKELTPSQASPTHVRWYIVGLLGVIAALTYLDRLNLSIAGEYIQTEYAFSTQTMGWILSSFMLGYAIFQVPVGWLGDRFGPRNLLTMALLWWSLFTAATAIAPRLPLATWFGVAWGFAIIRFLVGVGESATFPNSNKVVALWLSKEHRAVGNSLPFAGIGVGGVLTPLLIAWIMQRWGWRESFYICALLGIVVGAVWHFYATNRPEEHRRVNAAEIELIRGKEPAAAIHPATKTSRRASPPWRKMFRSLSVWGLLFSAVCMAYPVYIFFTWFFIYLIRVRGLSLERAAVWGCAPFLAIAILAPLGGWVSDRAAKKMGARGGRRLGMWVGMGCSAPLLMAGSHASNNILAILLLAGAAGFNYFACSSLWASCIDIAPNYSGSLSGLMNMFGQIGGWLSPILTALLATHFGWTRALDFAAVVTLCSGGFFMLVDANQNIEETGAPSEMAG
ncbi:MAG TPA: MFS transporter [Terriglobia bacterium]|nr:MFS transporter [Terriglobia bacterium]